MTLRLAGEDYSVVAGLDGLGWLRDIKATSSDPALKVDQKGPGSILDLLDSGTPVLRVLNGGNLAFLVGKAPTAGQYEIGRNSDVTNRLQYNVPTGALHEWSINDVELVTIRANQLGLVDGVIVVLNEPIRWDGNASVTGSQVQILREGSDLALNAPPGQTINFSINAVQKLLLSATGLTVTDVLEIDGALNHDGSNVGLYGVTPVVQASKINDPSGGATQDAEARTAINALIDTLEGIGIASAV